MLDSLSLSESEAVALIGILFSTLGSIVLAIDSQIAINNTTDILRLIKDSYGYVSMEPIHNSKPVQDLDKRLRNSRCRPLIGWLSIIVGFCFQIASVIL
ncbi:MAG: hypothetical protein RI580_06270 [Halothece sp. Uz-M2-17]|nr:hypothetical protein [Halothece sp. Uz-M2-17]